MILNIESNIVAPVDPFAEADEEPGDQKAAEYIHIRIQRMSTTYLKLERKACTIVADLDDYRA